MTSFSVYFTTVVRGAPLAEGGGIYHVDWDSKQVIGSQPIVPTDPEVDDPGSRGTTRGGRGLVYGEGGVVATSYHSLLFYDHDLELQRTVSHPLMANIHEVWPAKDGVWVSATAVDAVLRYSWEGELLEQWSPRNDPVCQSAFDLEPLLLEEAEDPRVSRMHVNLNDGSHCHVNAVADVDGRVHALLNSRGAVVRLNPTEVLVHDPSMRGCHNILPLGDGSFAVNDTVNRTVRIFDGDGTPTSAHDLTTDGEIAALLRTSRLASLRSRAGKIARGIPLARRLLRNFGVARPVFVRGLAALPGGDLLVGISPATVLRLDPDTGRILDRFQLSDDVRVCVHGIAVALGDT